MTICGEMIPLGNIIVLSIVATLLYALIATIVFSSMDARRYAHREMLSVAMLWPIFMLGIAAWGMANTYRLMRKIGEDK